MGNNQRQNQINQINEQRNQFNNQQRQQYIREKLNNFGRTQQRIKREAEPSMEYSVAASHPAQPEQMTRNIQNIRNNMNHPEISSVNNMYRNIYSLPVMKVQSMMNMVP